jgi:hypothetical protein
VAVFNIGVTGTDVIVKIVDHWTLLERQGHLALGRLFRASVADLYAGHSDEAHAPDSADAICPRGSRGFDSCRARQLIKGLQ